MARQLIESMTGPWQPSDYRDTYTDRVNDLIKAKKNNEEFQPRRGGAARDHRDGPERGAASQRGSRQEDGRREARRPARDSEAKGRPGRVSPEGTVQEARREEDAAGEESGQTAGP
jgi:DNA end-binding protein Ku